MIGRLAKPARVEPAADRLDHAVHHAGRGDHVGAGAGVADGLLGQQRQRRVVVDVEPAAGLGQRAAVAVVGVLAEAQVGDHQQPGRLPLGDPDRLLDDPVVARGGRAARVLVLRDAEEEDRRDAQLGHLGDRLAEPVERELVLAGHRRDLPPQVLAVVDEQRIDQVVDGQPRSRGPGRGAGDGRGAGGDDGADNRRRAGRSFGCLPSMLAASVSGTGG